MFNKNFYPTPKVIVEKMINSSSVIKNLNRNIVILEPSAGKGDIVDTLVEHFENSYRNKPNIHTIEIEPDLQGILRSKNYKVIASDFLKFSTNTLYDLIIMNPPFDNGAKHFLKAYEILKNGELICLLNAETINNPYSFERQKLIQIVKDSNGEIVSLGKCFTDAERKTAVDVVMIRLEKQYFSDKIFDEMKFETRNETPEFEEKSGSDLVSSNFIQSSVDTYNAVIKLIPELFKTLQKLHSYGFGISYKEISKAMDEASYDSNNINNMFKIFHNKVNDIIRKNAWETIFNKTNISQTLTSSTRAEIEILKKENGEMEFSVENIENLIEILLLNKGKIMEKCIEEAFERLTKYYEENRVHIEGWKTNDKYKVNRKFILPYIVEYTKYSSGGEYWTYSYSSMDELDDLDRAVCHITGLKYNNIKTISDTIISNVKNGYGDWIESEFFKIRYYKKGTAHFIFKDEYVWKMFNLIACKSKQWLPEGNSEAENLLLLGNDGNIK